MSLAYPEATTTGWAFGGKPIGKRVLSAVFGVMREYGLTKVSTLSFGTGRMNQASITVSNSVTVKKGVALGQRGSAGDQVRHTPICAHCSDVWVVECQRVWTVRVCGQLCQTQIDKEGADADNRSEHLSKHL